MTSLPLITPQKNGTHKAIVLLSNETITNAWLTVIIEKMGFLAIRIKEKLNPIQLESISVEIIVVDNRLSNSLIEQNLRELKSLSHAPVLCLFDSNLGDIDHEKLFLQYEDFILKPFSPEEFLLRVQKVLACHKYTQPDQQNTQFADIRKPNMKQSGRILKQPYFIVDENARLVKVEGKPIYLTPKEYKLFSLLASNIGHIFSNQEIINTLWSGYNDATNKNVQQYIYSLRKKIEPDPSHSRFLINVTGFGYKLDARKTIRSS